MPRNDDVTGRSARSIPELETDRLVLRPFELTDAPAVQALAGARSIADVTLNVPHPYEDGMAEDWIAMHVPGFELGVLLPLAITLRGTAELAGAISLKIDPESNRAELGYWLGEPYWGRGYCSEAALAVLRYGFDELKLNRIHASHFARNPASGRVLQKIGMQHEGIARAHVRKWDGYEDLVLYGLLRDEWRQGCVYPSR
ncbi:MAG: GNAT family N-acetyltransferase [Gammaproteobacteria bacterium]|nr:GNAT family N-acetyltransferase [Gammaproteobacteria bacterium]MDH4254783.1 GNAT family N-acetyltransferase [Gammaproteobacteria bacterium]MDH5311320.1 GNAT family N-acetyltransferase [Gammaproteobacteria bacterium]